VWPGKGSRLSSPDRGKFLLTAAAGWALLGAAGVYYARLKNIPPSIAAPILAACLIEYVFYLIPGFEDLRYWLADRIPVRTLAFALALSALAPYLIYSLPTGQFSPEMLARLGAIVLAISFWYVWQRPSHVSDLSILAIAAAPIITRFFRHIYTTPVPSIPVYVLGHLMIIRLVASVMLMLREVDGTGYGFVPTAREWKIGLRYFAWFLPVGLALSAALRMIHFRVSWTLAALAPLQFLGMLWGLALSEEFLARGLLQRWISDWTGRENLALLCASAIFGLSHLWFHTFPDWKQAIVAAALGWFCGKAYVAAGGIRAPMVTHALVATLWRSFLS
jgi:membrane protease YdiL (CAAX protease family)